MKRHLGVWGFTLALAVYGTRTDALAASQQHGELLWQKAYVGMTAQKIQALYPSVARSEGSQSESSHTLLSDKNYMIDDCKTELSFEFDHNALMAVSIELLDKGNMTCQSSLHGSVNAKYGPPTSITFPRGIRSESWSRKGGVTIEVLGGSFPSINEYQISILYYKTGNKKMENSL
ncbi:hypothetical protein [Acetobacter persici]|uniref:hypothetical protein n=1 Tax=Acetobacter persici TaxID=1076596 RepID=UPI001178AECB|nr:hypothetical protein [Acetobacter persici]